MVATRKGIILGFKKFRLLSKLLKEINEHIPKMVDTMLYEKRPSESAGCFTLPRMQPKHFPKLVKVTHLTLRNCLMHDCFGELHERYCEYKFALLFQNVVF